MVKDVTVLSGMSSSLRVSLTDTETEVPALVSFLPEESLLSEEAGAPPQPQIRTIPNNNAAIFKIFFFMKSSLRVQTTLHFTPLPNTDN
jgi:hypothetical protein